VHLVEAVDAGGGLFGDALDGGELLGVPAGSRREAYSARMAMRPGISVSAMAISRRPQGASEMSAT
jgi:hypothetical protein